MTKALSPTMTAALDLIKNGGGKVYPVRGGYWSSSVDGDHLNCLRFPADKYGIRTALGTLTIYALYERGLLRKIEGSKFSYHSAYELV